jgi:soluble lytic murein transglycosylase-like protein
LIAAKGLISVKLCFDEGRIGRLGGAVHVTIGHLRRLALASAALTMGVSAGPGAWAQSAPHPLSAADAQRYAAAFAASDRGDFIDAQMKVLEIQDQSLAGYLSYDQLMHPKAHRASFDELEGWLARFRDLPIAGRIFGLAQRRKPLGAQDPPTPTAATSDTAWRPGGASLPERDRQARDAFSAGEADRALALAVMAGDRWMQGLAAYRLQAYDQARAAFGELARDASADAWLRSAAAFWSARAATALGQAALATQDLRLAAQAPQTFYGMIAARQLRRSSDAPPADDRVGLLLASFAPAAPPDESDFVARDARAHRAAALAQIGHLGAAADELRAGVALARSAAEKASWRALGLALGAPLGDEGQAGMSASEAYPVPLLEPAGGFTLDKALVYAIVRQESRFDPLAISPKGAVGLMQLMPESAARAAGDDKLRSDIRPLFDSAYNLRVGQDYLAWLMERAVGYDLIRSIAAYNGGPGMVQRAAQMLGPSAADPLLLMESLPALETRQYVQKVLAGYWTYKAMFGEETPSLEALAAGAQTIDARLDLTEPAGAGTQLSGQLLQPALR